MPKLVDDTYYLGVDPGVSGGLTVLNGTKVITCPIPPTERDIWDWLQDNFSHKNRYAVLEKVGGFIGGGGKNIASSHTTFKLGASYGMLKGFLIASGTPFEEVLPRKWQKGLGIPSKGKNETRTEWKNRLKARAQSIFPSEKVTLANSDSLLLALYAQRSAMALYRGEGKL